MTRVQDPTQARRIRELRARLDLSQERFARLLDVSMQTVRRWESGLARPLPIISVRLEELRREAATPGLRTGGIPMRGAAGKGKEGTEAGLGGVFKGIGSLLDLVSRMAEEGREEHTRSGEVQALGGRLKGVYGFSVRMGLGGAPVIEQFGNIRETEGGPVVAEAREPLVDVLDEGDTITVIAELPGVEEKDIHLRVEGDILEIAASGKGRKYQKEVLLPSAVLPERLKSSHRNGVLEVRLAKK